MANTIEVPFNFKPRDYQLAMFQALDGIEGRPETKKKRVFCRWHRRAGKDKACFAYMCKEMAQVPGIYYYFFPTYQQGRMALWEAVDKDGFKVLHHLPKELVKRVNNQEMLIELTNGSIFRIVGTDTIDRIVGTNPRGCVFSEYSLQDPMAWTFISPILAENGGWAIFNGTPRGRNHMYKLEKAAENWNDWYISALTVEDTGLINNENIRAKIDEDREVHGKDYVEQEYWVAYSAGVKGAFYSDQLEQAERSGRIGDFVVSDHKWVDTFWDLGMRDDTAIWFRQIEGNKIIFVDYYESSGKDLAHYIEVLKNKGYKYRTHYLPHDGGNSSIQTGLSAQEMMIKLSDQAGISSDWVVCPRVPIQDGINAVRSRFSYYHFNRGLMGDALEKLALYHRRWDPKRQVFLKEPVHDYTSHSADALRTEAVAEEYYKDGFYSENKIKVITDFDPLR